jgi:hypothetical protein
VNYIREARANRIVQHHRQHPRQNRRNYKTAGLAVTLAAGTVVILAANADTYRSEAADAQRMEPRRQIHAGAASGPEPARSEPVPEHKKHEIPELVHDPNEERPERRKDKSPGWADQREQERRAQKVTARQDRQAPRDQRRTPYATARAGRGRGRP